MISDAVQQLSLRSPWLVTESTAKSAAKKTFPCQINSEIEFLPQIPPGAAQIRPSRPHRSEDIPLPASQLLLHGPQLNRHEESLTHTRWREIVQLCPAELRLSRTNNGTIEKVTCRISQTIRDKCLKSIVPISHCATSRNSRKFNRIYRHTESFFICIRSLVIGLIDQSHCKLSLTTSERLTTRISLWIQRRSHLLLFW